MERYPIIEACGKSRATVLPWMSWIHRMTPIHDLSHTRGRMRRASHWSFSTSDLASSRSTSHDSWEQWTDAPDVPKIGVEDDPSAVSNAEDAWLSDITQLADALKGDLSKEEEATETMRWDNGEDEIPRERVFLVGAALKSEQRQSQIGYSLNESLAELGCLADSAGLEVVGQTYQLLEEPNPRTYVGSGKVSEIIAAVHRMGADTVIFDDELSPGQLRNLERALGGSVRLCDRTALILDLFSQRAATREGQLQVQLAQAEYQLPRLTRMWSHLERQTGGAAGRVRGMGEKQIEVDRRLLRSKAAKLRRDIEEVRMHRRSYRARRAAASIPVVALVGYTNAGKSTLLNRLTDAKVLAEDRLFATLDPTTRRITMSGGQEVLLSDTVGFIQKLPTQLVAAFRATLEEIAEATLLMHVVDASHPAAAAQTAAVNAVLKDLGVLHVPSITVWNKVSGRYSLLYQGTCLGSAVIFIATISLLLVTLIMIDHLLLSLRVVGSCAFSPCLGCLLPFLMPVALFLLI